MSTIAELEARVNELAAALNEARRLLRNAKLEVCPVKVGDIVLHEGAEHRVVDVDTEWDINQPWLTANPKREDGSWSRRRRRLYSRWTFHRSGP